MQTTRTATLAWALATSLRALAADAQTITESDRLTRVELVRMAAAARAAGRLQEALDLALRAEQIGPTAGTRLLVAQTREQLGDHVGALASAEQCLREVDADTQTTAANRQAIRERCLIVQSSARARIGTLLVEVPDGSPAGLEVRVDGVALRPALYNISRPVNAGVVTVSAALPGASPWERRIAVNAGSTEVVRVEVPRPPEATPAPTPTPPTTTAAPAPSVTVVTTPAAPVDARASGGSALRTIGLVTAGAGVALAAGGAAAGLMFQSTAADYESQRCASTAATADCRSLYGQLQTLNALQWTGYVVGGAAVATGLVLFFIAPRARPRASAFACAPHLGAAGISCVTTF